MMPVKNLAKLLLVAGLVGISGLVLGAGLITVASPTLAAGPTLAQGQALFNSRQYPQAAAVLTQVVKANPKDATAHYYLGLSYQYCRNFSGAEKVYKTIIGNFPGSTQSSYAQAALQAMRASLTGGGAGVNSGTGMRYGQSSTSSSNSGSNSGSSVSNYGSSSAIQDFSGNSASGIRPGLDTMPDECYVPFERQGNSLIVTAQVNNRPLPMIFDTGAAMMAFGKNNLDTVGLPHPTGKPAGQAHGVGDGGAQNVWDMTADVRLGPIERKRFPISVQEVMPGPPLLGQTFFQDFKYTIDNGANTIHFIKKSKVGGSIYDTGARDPNSLPFVRRGNEMYVEARVNGKPTQFIFDTGAEMTMLSRSQMSQLGISVPADAQVGTMTGIAGSSKAYFFTVDRMQAGPIDQRDVMISCNERDNLPCGLLGQSFFKDWQYSIDYTNNRIKFLRR